MLEIVEYFDGSPVFTVTLPDEPEKTRFWFRASEVCEKLEFSQAYSTVQRHCKEWHFREFKVGMGRPALYVCLSGLTRLMMASKSPCAVEFQDWLHDDLLPKLYAGTLQLVNNPQQALALATPQTSTSDRAAFLYRDSQVRNCFTLVDANKALNYSYSKKIRHGDKFVSEAQDKIDDAKKIKKRIEAAVWQRVCKHLIYGHDYFWDEETGWNVTYVGMEYLMTFARSKKGVNPMAIGISHAFINFEKSAVIPGLPMSANGFLPKMQKELPLSALMKSGQVDCWYPVNIEGLFLLEQLNDQSKQSRDHYENYGYKLSEERFSLFATLDTDHFSYFPAAHVVDVYLKTSYRLSDTGFRSIGVKLFQHAKAKNLYQIKSLNKQNKELA